MIIIPCYELVMLPGVTYYLPKDIVKQVIKKNAVEGEDVVFLIQKNEKETELLQFEDFYQIGVK